MPTLPLIWAQATGMSNSDTLAILALRRWYESLSLSSPRSAPSLIVLWAWLGGLALALTLALVVQGPKRALKQLFHISGHVQLFRAALIRLRNAARMVAILCGVVVTAWTAGQFVHYNDAARLSDLVIFTSKRSIPELAIENGILAGLTPFRDLVGLGDMILLLVVAAGLIFKLSADRWGDLDHPYADIENPIPNWTTLCWIGAWLYAMYRFASLIVPDTGGLPLGLGFFPEIAVIPVLTLLADGVLLAWVLVELRNATLSDAGTEGLDVRGAVAIWPGAMLACLAAAPARYIAPAAWLLTVDLPTIAGYLRGVLTALILGWGLVGLQSVALATSGLAGAVPWSGGRGRDAIRTYLELIRVEGGRIVIVLAFCGLLAALGAGTAYLLVLSMPRQPWVLAAADSYAHYATLPVGLLGLSALVELGMRALPRAAVIEVPILLEVEASAPA